VTYRIAQDRAAVGRPDDTIVQSQEAGGDGGLAGMPIGESERNFLV
jgi:hypothetical protein